MNLEEGVDGIDTTSNFAGLILSRASVEEDQLLLRCKKYLRHLNNSYTKSPSPSSDWIRQLMDDIITSHRLLSILSLRCKSVREDSLDTYAVPGPLISQPRINAVSNQTHQHYKIR